MPEDTYANGNLATRFHKAEKDGESISSAMDRARLSSTAGSGLGSKGKALTGAPKQEPGEDPKTYGERLRRFREGEVQKKAFR